MRSTIKGIGLDITDSLREYLEKKVFLSFGKRLKNFPRQDAIIIDCELSRDTKHHKKGEVFRAEAHITVPPRYRLHAATTSEDIHSAIDLLESAILREWDTYKSKTILEPRRKIRQNKRD